MRRVGVPVRGLRGPLGGQGDAGRVQGATVAARGPGGAVVAVVGGRAVRAAAVHGQPVSAGQAVRVVQLPDGTWAVVG